MNNGITKDNLLFTLPGAVKSDESTAALGDATAEALARRLIETDIPRIIPNIDELPEDLLNILARDFKVDWWDPEYSVEVKRRVLKSSWRVHKTLGTKAAVVTAIRDIYPDSDVEEWFEYGGEPYHFRLDVELTNGSGDKERRKRFLERVNFYKSLRSHNDGVRYFIVPEKAWTTVGGILVAEREVHRREIPTPELIKPGGRAAATVGGKLITLNIHERATVPAPELTKPGGRARAVTGCTLSAMRQSVHVSVRGPTLDRPTGTALAAAGGGVAASYERRGVNVRAAVKRPGGEARAACGGAVAYSYQRQTVKVAI